MILNRGFWSFVIKKLVLPKSRSGLRLPSRRQSNVIGMSLFKNCESLESVLISDSVIKAEDTFLGMPSTTYVYGYVPSEIANICADEKINFVEVYEGDDKDRQMKDRSIVIPKTDEDK